jgi:YfiH family protein
LVVASADCVPLLFWDERTNAVAAVHAGWRGTLANAAAAAVAELESARGVKAQELRVAMGPAIRACCFEVGEEVVAAFDGSGRDMRRIVRTGASPTGRTHLDLIEDNRIQLREAGIPDDRIYDSNRCTVCDNERFYSFRKEGEGVGRVLGMIAPRPNRS